MQREELVCTSTEGADLRRMRERYGDQIRAEQLQSVVTLAPFILAANLACCALVLLFFWNRIGHSNLALWASAICLTSAGLMISAVFSPSPRAQPALSYDRLYRFVGSAFIMGVLWAVAPVLVHPVADMTDQLVICLILVGLMFGCAVTLMRVPYSAMAFTLPAGAGALIGVELLPGPSHLTMSALIVAYIVGLMFCIRWGRNQYVASLLDRFALAEQSQVICLLLRDFEENSSDWLWQIDRDGILEPIPLELPHLGANKPQQELMRPGAALIHLFAEDDNRNALCVNLERHQSFRDLPLQAHDGRWLMLTGRPIFDETRAFAGFRGVASDVTLAKQTEDQISYLAHHDGLTGLPNRTTLLARLAREVQAPPKPDMERGLIWLDLDNFKWVNDTLGHPAGDHLLRLVSDRILSTIGETGTVARLGGDEFAILLERPRADGGLVECVKTLCSALKRPYEVWGSTVRCSASIGVRIFDCYAGDAQTVLKHADLALYKAKQSGKANWSLFTSNLEIEARNKRDIENDLQDALDKDQLRVYFQPQIDARTRRLTGMEALLRWQHPTRGLIYPDEFIEAAEDSGLITRLGDWVIDAALSAARTFPEHMKIAVNISPLQVHSANLFSTIVNALAAYELDPARLELEITESVLLTDTEFTLDRLHKLKSLGLRIALDDFGTGYSSLSYLRKFPFDKIKIDKSFINDLESSDEAKALTRTTLDLAKSLGLDCTAEGIETEYQSRFLTENGCDELQGFLVSRALPIEKLTHLIEQKPEALSTPGSHASPSSKVVRLPSKPNAN